jgi:predicted 3-demethylubiquinone-9 3-methyltransferase (glyoxalase superfamily)
MFQGQASDALAFYLAIFPDSRAVNIERYGADDAGPEGSIRLSTFSIGGQEVLCTDSFIKHEFSFTPAFSFFVECQSEEQLKHLANALKDGGSELMAVDDYGFSRLFTWVNDRFGVSWQLNWT